VSGARPAIDWVCLATWLAVAVVNVAWIAILLTALIAVTDVLRGLVAP